MNYIWVVFPVIIVLWLIYGFAVASTSETWVVSGQFGDMFGAFTALVSGLAFAGIIIAIFLQRQDLKHQREELRLQREVLKLQRIELARSAVAQEKQSATLIKTAELNAYGILLGFYSDPTLTEYHFGPLASRRNRIFGLTRSLEQLLGDLDQQPNDGSAGGEVTGEEGS